MEGLEEQQWSDFNGITPSNYREVETKEVIFWPQYKWKANHVRKTILDAFLDKNQIYFSALSNELELTISFTDNVINLSHKKIQSEQTMQVETPISLDAYYRPPDFFNFQANNIPVYPSKNAGDYFSRPGVWIIRDVFYCDWTPYEHKPLKIDRFSKFENLLEPKYGLEKLNAFSLTSWFSKLKNESEFINDLYDIIPSQRYGPSVYPSKSKATNYREDAKIILTRKIGSNILLMQKFEWKFSLETKVRELNCVFSKEYSMLEMILFEKYLYLCRTIRGIYNIDYCDEHSNSCRVYIKD